MATSLLVRWSQTKKFLLIELERLNHKTYYTFNIIYVYLGGGGVQFEQDFFIHSLKINLSEIPIPYHIDLKEIATIAKPPLMTMHLFSQQWWPSYFFVDFFSWCCLSTCQKKHFIEPNMFYSPKMVSVHLPHHTGHVSSMATKANLAYYRQLVSFLTEY